VHGRLIPRFRDQYPPEATTAALSVGQGDSTFQRLPRAHCVECLKAAVTVDGPAFGMVYYDMAPERVVASRDIIAGPTICRASRAHPRVTVHTKTTHTQHI